MTTQAIIESGMTFGPYPAGRCFYIEKSAIYEQIKTGVQMSEFLLLKDQQQGTAVWVVEAKSSSPQPETQPNFTEFINEICTKLTNGFLLTVAACLQRHPETGDELPNGFTTLDLQASSFRFVLVINRHKQEWLPPLQNALEKALKPTVKIWGLPPTSVVVLNHELAQRHGLILPAVEGEPG
ncbi:hypothetical protein G9455_00615 [Aeromonas hydrophila]|uniref:hypothetical protein n=1 Tax=Aeromonas hydrophila TaxID=644 RepID=UPI00072096D3|nr:hypothetical protein [Aeromonas hydrophila]ALQ61458.1 hypothetical protein AS145_00400 [Aeromonas hydrophila]ALZ78158.1 hypothetical protein AhyD4_00400 [Aeromonas hydrophila]ODM28871.1 hypothetical protein A7J16_17845 [Aeromonas hydrophila]QIO16470.1 hypothetical protein G9455_00615 [Aeromonas hydrophila]